MPLVRVSNGGSTTIESITSVSITNKSFPVKEGCIYLVKLVSNSNNFSYSFSGANVTIMAQAAQRWQDGAGYNIYPLILIANEDGTVSFTTGGVTITSACRAFECVLG